MSARDLLSKELAALPDEVAQRLLDYLHTSLPAGAASRTPPATDYFEAYWSRWYGRCDSQTWDEPAELPFKQREAWGVFSLS
jgi:hypothetical protein